MLYAIIWFMSKAELPTPEQTLNAEPLPEKKVRSIGDTAVQVSSGEADQSGQTPPTGSRSFTKPVGEEVTPTWYTLIRGKVVPKQGRSRVVEGVSSNTHITF